MSGEPTINYILLMGYKALLFACRHPVRFFITILLIVLAIQHLHL